MKLACVIHRFGPQITGGSEAHCLAIAMQLAARHEVEVLTSCATDYVTWANVLPPGEEQVGPLRVRRFPVARPRHLNRFREISEWVFAEQATPAEQESWFRENGPEMPALLDHLRAHGAAYDRVLFWSFRYYPAFFGVPIVADRAILVPTAEDDQIIRTGTVLGDFFALPRAYLFLTPEEQTLVAARCRGPLPPSAVIGAGLAAPEPASVSEAGGAAMLDRAGVRQPYALYVGRIEKNKGCDRLIADVLAYADSGKPAIDLVMAGPAIMPIPSHPAIKALGFVPAEARDALLAHARVLVMPSPYESLSMVLLEAWRAGTPALVNGRCKPLRGQTERANGGLFYEHGDEFIDALSWFVTHPDQARQFGEQGRAYVAREYQWPVVLEKIERMLRA
jgi:glycosyltransferase involved in cell wall biosynthesis